MLLLRYPFNASKGDVTSVAAKREIDWRHNVICVGAQNFAPL